MKQLVDPQKHSSHKQISNTMRNIRYDYIQIQSAIIYGVVLQWFCSLSIIQMPVTKLALKKMAASTYSNINMYKFSYTARLFNKKKPLTSCSVFKKFTK